MDTVDKYGLVIPVKTPYNKYDVPFWCCSFCPYIHNSSKLVFARTTEEYVSLVKERHSDVLIESVFDQCLSDIPIEVLIRHSPLYWAAYAAKCKLTDIRKENPMPDIEVGENDEVSKEQHKQLDEWNKVIYKLAFSLIVRNEDNAWLDDEQEYVGSTLIYHQLPEDWIWRWLAGSQSKISGQDVRTRDSIFHDKIEVSRYKQRKLRYCNDKRSIKYPNGWKCCSKCRLFSSKHSIPAGECSSDM